LHNEMINRNNYNKRKSQRFKRADGDKFEKRQDNHGQSNNQLTITRNYNPYLSSTSFEQTEN